MDTTATQAPSLYLLPEALDALMQARVNPLDLLAEHRRQAGDTSVHALPNGEGIGVMGDGERLVMLVVPGSLIVRQAGEVNHGQVQ